MTYFHAEAPFNAPLPSSPRRLYAMSDPVVHKLDGWVHNVPQQIGTAAAPRMSWADGAGRGADPWISDTVSIWHVTSATPRYKVTLNPSYDVPQDLQAYFNSVPIPDGAKGNATRDKSIAIVDPGNGWAWEIWGFDPGTLKAADAAGVWKNHWQKSGIFDEWSYGGVAAAGQGARWGVRAPGFSLLAGVITPDEVLRGVIPHALALEVPWVMVNWFASPAQRTDGQDAAPDAVPYGARLVLPAAFDHDAYCAARGFTPTAFDRMLVVAAKGYGIIPVDQTGGGVGFVCESASSWMARNPGAANPWYAGGVFGGDPQVPGSGDSRPAMRRFPWASLQMLKPVLRRNQPQ